VTQQIFAVLYVSIMGLTRSYKTKVFLNIYSLVWLCMVSHQMTLGWVQLSIYQTARILIWLIQAITEALHLVLCYGCPAQQMWTLYFAAVVSIFLFSCLFSVVRYWMSTMIWPYYEFRMHVWNVLHAKYRMETLRKKLPSVHHRTSLPGYISANKACIGNWKKC